MRGVADVVPRLVVVIVLVAVSACAGGTPQLHIETAQAAPPVAGSSQLTVTIVNSGDGDDELLGAATDAADAIEIHETVIAEQRATMREHDSVAIPAGTSVAFRPGGLHLMLVVPDPTLREGDTFEVTFDFAHSDDRTITVEVVDFLELAESGA
ncbi:MAG: copper chaperone PCu(A)C [Nitriliruptoraceae bacterium]